MAELDFSIYEVAGFNGAVFRPCARSLAIGRVKDKDLYFVADNRFFQNGAKHPSVAKYSLSEIETYEVEGRLNLISAPFPMVQNARVLHATEELLTSRGYNPKIKPIAIINGQNLVWQKLPERDYWVTCSDEETIDQLFSQLR